MAKVANQIYVSFGVSPEVERQITSLNGPHRTGCDAVLYCPVAVNDIGQAWIRNPQLDPQVLERFINWKNSGGGKSAKPGFTSKEVTHFIVDASYLPEYASEVINVFPMLQAQIPCAEIYLSTKTGIIAQGPDIRFPIVGLDTPVEDINWPTGYESEFRRGTFKGWQVGRLIGYSQAVLQSMTNMATAREIAGTMDSLGMSLSKYRFRII